MKALSIRQPWAWAIFEAGKDIENRNWSESYSARRELRSMISSNPDGAKILIHASTVMTNKDFDDAVDTISAINAAALPIPPRKMLLRGGIIGRVHVLDIVIEHASPWFFGPVGLVLRTPERLAFHPCKGMLGLFDVEDEMT